jgi:hypothetical protein
MPWAWPRYRRRCPTSPAAQKAGKERISSLRAFGRTRHATSKKSRRNASHSLHRWREHQADARLLGEKGAGSTWSHMSSTSSCDSATASAEFHDFGLKVPSMSVDLMLPAAKKITLVLEGIGDDKIRVNSSSLDHPLVILPDQALEIVAIEKKVMVGRVTRSAYWLNRDPSGIVDAGYGTSSSGDEVVTGSMQAQGMPHRSTRKRRSRARASLVQQEDMRAGRTRTAVRDLRSETRHGRHRGRSARPRPSLYCP